MNLENKIYMLTTKDCTKCPFVKQILATKNVEVEYIDNEEDPTIASFFEIMSVPSIIDNRHGNKTTHIGQQSCLSFVNSI